MSEHIINFWQIIASGSVSVVITLITFWLGIGRKIVLKDQISEMIRLESPYTQDKQFIMERLASNKETQTVLTNTLQRNTEVMTELKIQIATLGKTLEALEDRIERSI